MFAKCHLLQVSVLGIGGWSGGFREVVRGGWKVGRKLVGGGVLRLQPGTQGVVLFELAVA